MLLERVEEVDSEERGHPIFLVQLLRLRLRGVGDLGRDVGCCGETFLMQFTFKAIEKFTCRLEELERCVTINSSVYIFIGERYSLNWLTEWLAA